MEDDELLEVSISDVSITNIGFAIFLKPLNTTSEKVVPIFVGPLEAYSISSALDCIMPPPRPNTHDLMIKVFEEIEAQILHTVINDIIGSIFYARIVVKVGEKVVEFDARPSDSIAVAIRSKCPILIKKNVYEDASVRIENEPRDELGKKPEYKPKSKLERLQQQLESAVEIENFEEAAKLRDEINKISHEN